MWGNISGYPCSSVAKTSVYPVPLPGRSGGTAGQSGTCHASSCFPQLHFFWYHIISAPQFSHDHSCFCVLSHSSIPCSLMNARLGSIVQWWGHLSFMKSWSSLQGYSSQKQQKSRFLSFVHVLNLQFETYSSTFGLWHPSQSWAPQAPQKIPHGPYLDCFIFLAFLLIGLRFTCCYY